MTTHTQSGWVSDGRHGCAFFRTRPRRDTVRRWSLSPLRSPISRPRIPPLTPPSTPPPSLRRPSSPLGSDGPNQSALFSASSSLPCVGDHVRLCLLIASACRGVFRGPAGFTLSIVICLSLEHMSTTYSGPN